MNRLGTRIRLDMTGVDVLMAIGEGNPGALNICCALMKEGPVVDPDSLLGELAPLLSLDQHGIYGPRIWMLAKDVCGGSIPKVLACLRAVQLGLLGEAALDRAIDNRGDGVDADDLLAKVREKLPRFNAPAKAATP